MVYRQLHHERRCFTTHDGVFEHQARQHSHHDTQYVQREDRQCAVLTKERRGKDGENRQTCAAGHKRRHHDGHQTLTRGVQRTCAHHGRYVTAKADDQRDERFARQSQRLHQTVHHKRGARHVAGVFKEGEEQVHHADLRYQRQHGVNPAAKALGQEDSEPVREVQRVANPLNTMDKECYGANVKQWLQRAADVNGEQEHQVHHEQENRQPEEAVENDFIYRGGETARFCRQSIADGIADSGNALIARIGDVQRRIVHSLAQACDGGIEILRGITRICAAVDIAFQHLQAQPAALFERHIFGHRVGEGIRFLQQRLGIMDQLDSVVFFVAIDRQLQRFNAAGAGGNQRNHRAAKTC